jgi:hypothetical protein
MPGNKMPVEELYTAFQRFMSKTSPSNMPSPRDVRNWEAHHVAAETEFRAALSKYGLDDLIDWNKQPG